MNAESGDQAMDHRLAGFLHGRVPIGVWPLSWTIHTFEVALYPGPDLPPLPLVTSVRAVVRRAGTVLLQEDRHSRHILPGGRREPDESAEATLRREVLEETGWSLDAPAPIGFVHFHHRDPRPPDHPYPYPDFCHLVYAAWAAAHHPDAILDDGFEVGSRFLPIAEIRHLPLTERELWLLDAALALDPPEMSADGPK